MARKLIPFVLALSASTAAVFALLTAWVPQPTRDTDDFVMSALTVAPRTWTHVDATPAFAELFESRPRAEWSLAVRMAARAWSRHDPVAALEYADVLPDEVRASFFAGVTEEWALSDPDGFFSYARSSSSLDRLRGGLASALIVEPEQVLVIAAEHPSVRMEGGHTLEELAVAAVAEHDPMAALAYLDALPLDERHLRLRGIVAETWARRAPAEALFWAEGLQPPAPGVVATVIAYTATSDVEAALNLLEFFEAPAGHPAVSTGVATPHAIARMIVRQIASNADRERIADRLLQRRTPHSLIALEELTTHWAHVDAGAATEWVIRAAERLPPELPGGLASVLAATDAEMAATLADRLPPDMRLSLARQIAPELARLDPFAAANWLEQFQEYVEYPGLYRSAVDAVAMSDPERAAAMLLNTPPATDLIFRGVEMHLEGMVARAWASRDLTAASAWVQGIADPARREEAVGGLARHWLRVSPEAAQQWVLGLPEDEVRQRAIDAMLMEAASGDYELEPDFVRAFRVGAERQEVLGKLVLQLAELDPRRGRLLAGQWITDPAIREQTQEAVDSIMGRYSLTDPE